MARKLALILSLLLVQVSASESKLSFFKEKVTWSEIDSLETKMEKWVKKVGEKDLIMIGKMRQRPDEVTVIRSFFPYLLPDDFFGKKMDSSCSPEFSKFQKVKNLKHYGEWKECLQFLYQKEIPSLLKRALKDLKPKK